MPLDIQAMAPQSPQGRAFSLGIIVPDALLISLHTQDQDRRTSVDARRLRSEYSDRRLSDCVDRLRSRDGVATGDRLEHDRSRSIY